MSARPIAVVTGASSGIGSAWARRLAREGWDLVLVARREDRLETLGQELRKLGAQAQPRVCDLSRPESREDLDQWLSSLPRLDLLVHNAGFGVTGPVGEADPRRLEEMAQVHVNATIALCSAVAPRMRAAGTGGIVVVSSIAGWLVGAGSAAYCATKAFETSFTRSLARELRPYGVRAMALCPGYTRTEFHDTDQYADWDRRNVPSWMWSTPDQVVDHAWKDWRRGKDLCIPGWINRAVVFAMGSGVLGLVRERVRRRGARAGK